MVVPQESAGDALRESGESSAERKARILTWNINGLRKVAANHGGVKQLLDQFNSDIGGCEFVSRKTLWRHPLTVPGFPFRARAARLARTISIGTKKCEHKLFQCTDSSTLLS